MEYEEKYRQQENSRCEPHPANPSPTPWENNSLIKGQECQFAEQ